MFLTELTFFLRPSMLMQASELAPPVNPSLRADTRGE
jgi:hypothetical protein